MSEAGDVIPDFQQDMKRILREYKATLPEGCKVLGKIVTLRNLRADIEKLVGNLGNMKQEAVGDELTACMTIWTQLALQHTSLCQLANEQLAYEYTPAHNAVYILKHKNPPPSLYCRLSIHARHGTNILGAFDVFCKGWN